MALVFYGTASLTAGTSGSMSSISSAMPVPPAHFEAIAEESGQAVIYLSSAQTTDPASSFNFKYLSASVGGGSGRYAYLGVPVVTFNYETNITDPTLDVDFILVWHDGQETDTLVQYDGGPVI